MPKWTDYTTKTEPADNDELMILDTAGKANKRLGLSVLSDWILNKIADKVFQKLETNNKTVLGAINELNSKTDVNAPTILSNVTEYIKTLPEGKSYLFRTTSGTSGNPFPGGSCLFMIYIISKSSDGIGISINHSSTAYYLRFSGGEITYIALS